MTERLAGDSSAAPASGEATRPMLQPATLKRRLVAMVYEALIITALLLVAGLIFEWAIALGVTQDGPSGWRLTGWPRRFFQGYLVAVLAGYFCWFWHRGQTLAMRTWRLHLVGAGNKPPSYGAALVRFVVALAFLGPSLAGLLWLREHPGSLTAWLSLLPGVAAIGFAATNDARTTLYDYLASTRLMVETKRAATPP